MSTSSSRPSSPKPISPEESIRGLTVGLAESDSVRAEGYAELSTLRAAKQTQLSRREALLALKYGADHPRVAESRAQQAVNREMGQQLQVLQIQVSTPLPQVDEHGYVFHGYVRNRRRQPLPGLTVALYEDGRWFRDLGYGCTDENGYFLLRFTEKTKDRPENPSPPPAGGPNDPGKSNPTTGTSGTATSTGFVPGKKDERASERDDEDESKTFEVRVYNSAQKLIYRDPTPLVARAGQIDFREIIIDDDAGRCTPPPGSTDDPPPTSPVKPGVSPRPPVGTPPKPSAESPSRAQPQPTSPPPAPPAPTQPSGQSTPLENIRGVGPKTADKLRASGIKDIESLEEVETKKLVNLAGMDKAASRKKPARKKKP